jgi:hypothetical protein
MEHVLEEATDALEEIADALDEAGLILLLYCVCHDFTSLSSSKKTLLGFLMAGVLLAEAAILVHFKTIGVVLLVLHGIVITLLALGACHRNLDTLIRCHLWTPPIMF